MEKPQLPVRTNKLEIMRRVNRRKEELEEVYSLEVPRSAVEKAEISITYVKDNWNLQISK